MNRRGFLKTAAAGVSAASWMEAAAPVDRIDLRDCVVIAPGGSSPRVKKAVTVLIEEVEKRSRLRWPVQADSGKAGPAKIFVGTLASLKSAGVSSTKAGVAQPGADGYVLRMDSNSSGRGITVLGADERGLLFGIGKLLRLISFGRDSAFLDGRRLPIATAPKYALRGHQLGYRAKTN